MNGVPYTGQINASGLAHGHGVVTLQSGTLKGNFVNGAPSIGIQKTSIILMSAYDEEGRLHGLIPLLSSVQRRFVFTFARGRNISRSGGELIVYVCFRYGV